MKEFRMFTMAMAEEEEVLKFYFYSKYKNGKGDEMILTEIVIDRNEKTIGFMFKYNDKLLFDFWKPSFFDYLKSEYVIQ